MRKRVLWTGIIAVALLMCSVAPAFAATQRTTRIQLSAGTYKGTSITAKGKLTYFRNGSWIAMGGRTVTLYRKTDSGTVKVASKVTSTVEGHEGEFSFKIKQAKNQLKQYVVRFSGYRSGTTQYRSTYKWFKIDS